MKIGHFKVKKIIANENGSLTLDCLTAAHIQLKNKIPFFSFNPFAAITDTWTKVIKLIINSYTTLPTHMISIKDNLGIDIPSESNEWTDTTVIDLLNDICIFTGSYIYIDEYNIPNMRTYETARLLNLSIERGKNIITNNVTKNATNIINSVKAKIRYTKIGEYIVSTGAFPVNRSTYAPGIGKRYLSNRLLVPPGAKSLSSYKLRVRWTQTTPGTTDQELKVLYSPSFQGNISPPYISGSPIALSIDIIPAIDITTSLELYEVIPSSIVNLTGLDGQYIWIAIEAANSYANSKTYVEYGFSPLNRVNSSTLPSSFNDDGTLAIECYGIGGQEFIWEGEYTDQNSENELGLRRKDIVSKNARSNEACAKYAENVVNYYKNELIDSQCSIPYQRGFYPGRKVVLHDPYYDLIYENLLISALKYTNTTIEVTLTQPDLNLVEFSDETKKDLENTDLFLLT